MRKGSIIAVLLVLFSMAMAGQLNFHDGGNAKGDLTYRDGDFTIDGTEIAREDVKKVFVGEIKATVTDMSAEFAFDEDVG